MDDAISQSTLAEIQVYDVSSNKLVMKRQIQNTGQIRVAAISADSKQLALTITGEQGTPYSEVQIWNIEKNSLKKTLRLRSTTAPLVQFLPNSERLFTSTWTEGRAKVQVWNTTTFHKLLEWNVANEQLSQLRLAPDNQTLITVDKNQVVRFWPAP